MNFENKKKIELFYSKEEIKLDKSNENSNENRFVPNFIKNPPFHYANDSFYSPSDQIQSKELPVQNIESIKSIKNTNLGVFGSNEALKFTKTIKIKDIDEIDFIEIDLDTENTTIEKFKEIIRDELELNFEILKIRKLPNILIRNNKDIKRLKDDQEIEIIFKKNIENK
jgi:hypothetical protein